tara:strand:+ start:239 stop:745 length:507 start_codon:yes stop_codon:yes gene_type:complete
MPKQNKTFDIDEIEELSFIYSKHFPLADRSQKSQIRNKWKTGMYTESTIAYGIIIMREESNELKTMYQKKEQELAQREKVEFDKVDEIEREQELYAKELDQRFMKNIRDEERLHKAKHKEQQKNEHIEQLREIIKEFRWELIDQKGNRDYDSWVDNKFPTVDKSYYGL